VKLKTESRVKLRFPTKKLNRRTSVRVCDLSGQMDYAAAFWASSQQSGWELPHLLVPVKAII